MSAPSWMGPGRSALDMMKAETEMARRRCANAAWDCQVVAEQLSAYKLRIESDVGVIALRNLAVDLGIAAAELRTAVEGFSDRQHHLQIMLRERGC